MKLIELLARELKEWPKDYAHALLTQTSSGHVEYVINNRRVLDIGVFPRCEDWITAIINREDWENATNQPFEPIPGTTATPTLETMLAEWRDLEARAQAAQAEADALFEHAGQCHGEIIVRLAELGWGAPRGPMVPGEPVVTLDDGWIEWNGGNCPVPNDAHVEVKLRGSSSSFDTGKGGEWGWRIDPEKPSGGDIVAYRLTPSTQP
jgi:hypothetical protein